MYRLGGLGAQNCPQLCVSESGWMNWHPVSVVFLSSIHCFREALVRLCTQHLADTFIHIDLLHNFIVLYSDWLRTKVLAQGSHGDNLAMN